VYHHALYRWHAKVVEMKTCQIPHTDLSVSRIAYGCAGLAGWNKDPISTGDITQAAKLIDTACANGITLFDHADLYGFGKAEELFGKILKHNVNLRDQIVIQSKCGQVFTEAGLNGPIRIDVTFEHIVRSVEGSLQRLATDRLDILLLHVADTLMQPQEVAQAFDELHQSGKVRYFGVSNHNTAQIELLKKVVRQPIVVNQVRLGLGYPDLLAEGMEFALTLIKANQSQSGYASTASGGTIDYCRLHDIQIQAWSPLRGATLDRQHKIEPGSNSLAQRLAELAEKKGAAPAAIALAWLLRHPAGIIPIIGSSKPEHIRESCAADGVVLSSEEWYSLFAAATEGKARSSE
jgi:predicted oxidoreductase